jgi:hypothetical protein
MDLLRWKSRREHEDTAERLREQLDQAWKDLEQRNDLQSKAVRSLGDTLTDHNATSEFLMSEILKRTRAMEKAK